jgi:hypothetical protein
MNRRRWRRGGAGGLSWRLYIGRRFFDRFRFYLRLWRWREPEVAVLYENQNECGQQQGQRNQHLTALLFFGTIGERKRDIGSLIFLQQRHDAEPSRPQGRRACRIVCLEIPL